MNQQLGDLAGRLGGELVNARADALATGWATDSREVKSGSVFLAIRGERVDGHQFVAQAIASGAVASVVEREVPGPHILVPDLVAALAKLGRSFRDEFNGPVIGITGSAGKTTTKEFIACALSPLGPVLKSEGNRNTEFTSPLIWSELMPSHQSAVIEMAMRGFNQVRHLASISRPTMAVITNIGFSHMEMVGSRDGVARAKAEILEGLPYTGCAILWREDDYFDHLSRQSPVPVLSFGFSPEADCQIHEWKILSPHSMTVSGHIHGKPWRTELPVIGPHNALAAAAAILVGDQVKVPLEDSARALSEVQLPGLRMEWRTLPNGALALVDAYNASPSSMAFALETLLAVPHPGKAFVALSAMRELGREEEPAHRELGRLIKDLSVERAILLGEPMRFAHEEIGNDRAKMAQNLDDFRAFLNELKAGDVVLVKGSRAYELENAIPGSDEGKNLASH